MGLIQDAPGLEDKIAIRLRTPIFATTIQDALGIVPMTVRHLIMLIARIGLIFLPKVV